MVGVAFDERSDRAQLILVGAVAIAFIVLGLAVVFNTVLYTENVASTGAASAPRDAQLTNAEIEVGVKGLIARTNVEGKWQTPTEARDQTKQNVSSYSDGLLRVSGAATPAVVSVRTIDSTEVVGGISGSDKIGAAIHHTDGQEFRSNLGVQDWTVVDGAAPIGGFNMTIKASSLAGEGSGDEFRLVWNATETNDNFSVWVYEDDTSGDVAIRTVNDSTAPATSFPTGATECVLDGADTENVEFDFSDGRILNHSDCSGMLNVSAGVPSAAKRSLSFFRGGSASGWYTLVVNDESAVGSSVTDNTGAASIIPSDSPYYTDAIWEIKLLVTYESGQVSWEDDYVIDVYNRTQ